MTLSTSILLLSGCLLPPTQSPIPTDGPTMLELYNTEGSVAPHAKRELVSDDRVLKVCLSLGGDAEEKCIKNSIKEGLVAKTVVERARDERALSDFAQRFQHIAQPEDYTRDAKKEITVLFPRLDNPDISIYIYPHLSTSQQVPIPGYTTVIPLFDKVEYAMPGESP